MWTVSLAVVAVFGASEHVRGPNSRCRGCRTIRQSVSAPTLLYIGSFSAVLLLHRWYYYTGRGCLRWCEFYPQQAVYYEARSRAPMMISPQPNVKITTPMHSTERWRTRSGFTSSLYAVRPQRSRADMAVPAGEHLCLGVYRMHCIYFQYHLPERCTLTFIRQRL